MANRRCLRSVIRHCQSLFSSTAQLRSLTAAPPSIETTVSLENPTSTLHQIFHCLKPLRCVHFNSLLRFSSQRRGSDRNEEDDEEEYEDEEDAEEDEEEEEDEGELSGISEGEDNVESVRTESKGVDGRAYSVEEKEEEAAAIGYKVIAPLDPTERPFKPWEPVFAVIQIGSHQFKVSNGDIFYTERLKFCEVNDKLLLNKVLMLGSRSQTVIGRPTLPEAAVYAVVEEHALDAKVIIFKKKRRKNYRRTKGHRQELTRLRIIDIQGIEKPEKAAIAA